MIALFRTLAPLVVTLTMFACTGDDSDDDHGDHGDESGEGGPPTESVCSATSDLTYENFGQPFMEMYCTHCHASTLMGAARNGAPTGHDFDTLEGILLVAEHIDEQAAAGPAATNTLMPPSGTAPTDDERMKLGEWLACEQAN